VQKGGLQPWWSPEETGVEREPSPDDDLHNTGAGRCRRKAGFDKLIEWEQCPLISAKAHAARRLDLQKRHQSDGYETPVLDDRCDLHHTDSSADGAGIDRTPDEELATAPTQGDHQGKNKRKRQEAFHNTTSVHEEGI